MVSRQGHSLVELIVTLTFLAATLGAIAGGAVAAVRWTSSAARQQEALAVAASTLDSLLASPAPEAGSGEVRGWSVGWEIAPDSAGRMVRVVASDSRTGLEAAITGLWIPVPPVLPSVP